MNSESAQSPISSAEKKRVGATPFPTPEMVAVAALTFRDDDTQLDSPESSRRLPIDVSCSNYDVQRAAQQVARDFNPLLETDSWRIKIDEIDSGFASDGGYEGGPAGFVDEEAVFNWPALIDSMAEGMLLTPPAMKKGFNWSEVNGDSDADKELTLWES